MEQDIKEQMEEQGQKMPEEGNGIEKEQINGEENKSEERKAEETKLEKTKSEEAKSEEIQPEETKSEEKKPEDAKTEGTKPGEGKPEETKPEENKAAGSENEEVGQGKPKRSSKAKKILFALLGVGISALIVAYICGANYYQTHFLPNTIIEGIDCSNLDEPAVEARILLLGQDYTLQITGRDEQGNQKNIGSLSTEDIDYNLVDVEGVVKKLLQEQGNWLWIRRFLESTQYSYDIMLGVSFDEDKLAEALQQMEACQKKNMVEPEDAYISEYSETAKGYEIVPETLGTQLDMDAVVAAVSGAIYGNANAVDLAEQGCYISAAVTKDNPELLKNLEAANRCLEARIEYNWNNNKVVVGLEEILKWATIRNNKLVLDEDAIAEFVAEQARTYDTYGKRRNFVTTLGVELSLPGGAYGWLTDREAETAELVQWILNGTSGEREPIYSSRGAARGSNDIGSSYVEADLTNQHLYLYQGGNLVLETDFVSGNMSNGNVTPPGVFGITYKTRDAVLRGADYVTPVSYWMPFNGNVGMHDATWRDVFGGDIYLNSGSHGCINLPLDMAAAIYDYMSEGFPVICYYY